MTKRKDGLWQQSMTVTINGRKVVKTFYGRTKQTVLEKIAKFKGQLQDGMPFSEVAELWWSYHMTTLSPTTVQGYLRGKNRAVEYFDNTLIKSIRPLDIQRFLTYCIDKWNMAKNTASNQRIVINQIMIYAVQNGYIDINPARDITIPKGLAKQQRKMPLQDDINKIKQCTDCTFGMFAYFAMYTGMRKGELLALQWKDIDLENRVIHVNKSVYNDHNIPKIKPPKTESGIRDIPILNKLYEKLSPAKGIVFNFEGGYITESKFRDLWEQYCKESQVSCTVHQLRHAFSTMLFENDIEVKDAQKILGHAQASTTQDIYTEIRKTRENIVKEKLLNADI